MPSTPAVRRPIDLRAFLICVALSFTWGLQQVAIKAAAPNISPMLQVGIRSGVSALLLLLTNHFWLHEKWGHEVKLRDAILVGLGFVGEFFFVSEGLRFTSAAHMSVLLYTSPFFAAIGLSIKLPEERLSVIQWAGLLTAFLGIAVAFLVPALLSKETLEGSGWILGDILGLGSGLSWGFTTIMLRTTSMNNAPPSLMLFAQLFMAFVILTPLAFITGQTTFHNSLVGWSSLLFQAVIVSYASYLVWNFLLKQYLAARLGVLVFMTPIFGVILSVLLLGESVGMPFIFGSLLVLAGLLLMQAKTILLVRKHGS